MWYKFIFHETFALKIFRQQLYTYMVANCNSFVLTIAVATYYMTQYLTIGMGNIEN